MSESGSRRFIRGHTAIALVAILSLFVACDTPAPVESDAEPEAGAGQASGTVAPVSEALGEGQPLVLVDGVVQGSDVDMEELEALDIARIEVVKGAAAEELRGERAADGVIQITTKEAAAREDQAADDARTRSDGSAEDRSFRVRSESAGLLDGRIRIEGSFGVEADAERANGERPLVIVDGVVQGPDANLEELNTSLDIESIEILKGAAAERLHGERGADGVIQITTKDASDDGG